MNFVYNGIEYDVGTKVKIKTFRYGEQIMALERGGVTGIQFVGDDYFSIPIRSNTANLIIEIVEPIYSEKCVEIVDNYNRPTSWDVEIGWIWYIIIMVVGTIFNDRLLIWGVATAVFFLWKNGKIGGNK